MRMTRVLMLTVVATGLLALTAPVQAQTRGNRGSGNRGGFRPGNGHGRVVHVVPGRFVGRGGRVNVYFGSGFYGWPYWGPYWGWGYPYAYAPYGYYYAPPPPPIYEGQPATDYTDRRRRTNDDSGK